MGRCGDAGTRRHGDTWMPRRSAFITRVLVPISVVHKSNQKVTVSPRLPVPASHYTSTSETSLAPKPFINSTTSSWR